MPVAHVSEPSYDRRLRDCISKLLCLPHMRDRHCKRCRLPFDTPPLPAPM